MPISAYFKGHGREVMASMSKGKSPKAAKREFYATANKTGMKPGSPKNTKAPRSSRKGY